MTKVLFIFSLLLILTKGNFAQAPADSSKVIQFVFTSDAHYGISRSQFRGTANVDAHLVNRAMVEKINSISGLQIVADSGVNAGHFVGPVDFLIEGGDIANRMEIPIQTAAISWAQFEEDYLNGLKLIGRNGKLAPVYIVPGNHDISNAIGFYRPMTLSKDASSMAGIYNFMIKPVTPRTKESFQYLADRIHYSKDLGGIHFIFITLWPDSLERAWMEQDLKLVSPEMPVILFTHDQPESEPKHFSNPNPPNDINGHDRFENLQTEKYKEGASFGPDEKSTSLEQRGLVQFLKKHPNIRAYFHGNSNYQESYIYHGPDQDIALSVFRVDSPMKGKYSSKDEKLLSFQLVSINVKAMTMTVRECLWNADPQNPENPIQWGAHQTVKLN